MFNILLPAVHSVLVRDSILVHLKLGIGKKILMRFSQSCYTQNRTNKFNEFPWYMVRVCSFLLMCFSVRCFCLQSRPDNNFNGSTRIDVEVNRQRMRMNFSALFFLWLCDGKSFILIAHMQKLAWTFFSAFDKNVKYMKPWHWKDEQFSSQKKRRENMCSNIWVLIDVCLCRAN